jgi:hypothetical protein
MVRSFLDNQQDAVWRMLGMPTNVSNPSRPASTNISFLGYSTAADLAATATKKGMIAAIPVSEGDVISNVSALIGATEGKTGVKSFFVVYSGTTAKKEASLLAQSKVAEVALKPKLILTGELEKAVLVNSETAPGGYLFVGLITEATTLATQVGVNVPTPCQKSYFAKGPEVLCTEVEQEAAGEGKAKIKTETALEKVPFYVLT